MYPHRQLTIRIPGEESPSAPLNSSVPQAHPAQQVLAASLMPYSFHQVPVQAYFRPNPAPFLPQEYHAALITHSITAELRQGYQTQTALPEKERKEEERAQRPEQLFETVKEILGKQRKGRKRKIAEIETGAETKAHTASSASNKQSKKRAKTETQTAAPSNPRISQNFSVLFPPQAQDQTRTDLKNAADKEARNKMALGFILNP